MDTARIKEIFKSEYKPEAWKDFITSFFPKRDFYASPIDCKDDSLKKHKEVKHIWQFGDITLDDKSRILFYEVEMNDQKSIVRNRVGMRNLIHTDVIPGDVDGIIATYYSSKSNDWRLSFISKSLYWDEEMNEIKYETHPKRYTYVLGENESIKTATKQFEWLANKIGDGGLGINDLIKTFSVEKISKEFFVGYRHIFEMLERYIIDNEQAFDYFKKQVSPNTTSADQQKEAERHIRNFAKKLMGRIVFLYFLQKKGWLGVEISKPWGVGDRGFISNLFNSFQDKNNFYTACLVPLFFDTLNRKRENDIFSITNTKVPYLNGGLFDKDPVEPIDIKIDPELFKGLFEFFDQYNFTIDENSPDDFDIGIDPEMLGLIFENLLEDNKDKGTFYTPKEVVHFMCKESIALYIKHELKNKATGSELKVIETFIKQSGKIDLDIIKKHANDIDKSLTNVKICDPAIGSGAFPMGMVYEIIRLKKVLFGLLDKEHFDYREEKLGIIQNSIYGVDLDQGAVDISRLRFWLSLIVDEKEPAPLPNLDYKIMQGNSLKEDFEGIPLDQDSFDKKVEVFGSQQLSLLGSGFDKPQKEIEFSTNERKQLRAWVKDYFKVTTRDEKEELHKNIDKKVIEHIERNVELKENQVIRLRSELEETYKSTGKEISTLTKTGRDYKKWDALNKEIAEIERKKGIIKELQNSAERPWFLWNLFFGDVLLEGNKGFDIVIGNPPYGVKVKDEIKNKYDLSSKDSYGVFMAMALKKLVKEGGVLSYIVSDTWLTIKSHFELREQLLQHALKKIIRLHIDCFDATVNPCIFTLQKTKTGTSTDVLNSNKVIAADLTNISTRKEVPDFREKLFHLEALTGEYNEIFAVYSYNQGLLSTNTNKPVIVGSPKLFAFMNNTTCDKETINIGTKDEPKEIEVRKITINDQIVDIVRFGDIADVKVGLQTGDNNYYLYQNPEARGSYKNINDYKQYLLTEKDLEKIRNDENIRIKVIEQGIHKSKREDNFDKERWFEGRYIVPYDKGGESDTDEGWLPNYYVATNYYIDWSCESVNRLKSYKIADRIRKRNESKTIKEAYETTNAAVIRSPNTYFRDGFTFSRTGVYSPTFRINSASIFDTEGSTIFISPFFELNISLAVLTSKIVRYLVKSFIGHTVHAQVEELKEIPFVKREAEKALSDLVKSIMAKQQNKKDYNYISNEQIKIDPIVYSYFNLTLEDINEIEAWYARRYPKLAKYAYYKPHEEIITETVKDDSTEKIEKLIESGESRFVEFKSSLRYCLNQKSPQKYIEHAAIKNLAAFLNTEGGTLLIGVDDNGTVLGLEDTDFSTFKGANKNDEWLKHFDNLIEKYFGNGFAGNFNIALVKIADKTLASIEIAKATKEPVFIKNPEKQNQEEFYIRRNASAKLLTIHEFYTYSKERFNR